MRPTVSASPPGRVGWGERLLGEALVVLALAGWWFAARGLPDFVLPNPLAVGSRLIDLFFSPTFLGHTLVSTLRVVGAVIIATVLGGALALMAVQMPWLEKVVHDRIQPVLGSFPSIGWAILAAIWFDVGNFSVVFVEVAILTPFCLANVREGLAHIDREVVEMGRSFTRSRWRTWWLVTLPLLMPYVLAAVRIAYGVGWKIALVSELLGAPSGLGYLMLQAQTTADSVTFLATCFAIVVVFMAGERWVLMPLEARWATRH